MEIILVMNAFSLYIVTYVPFKLHQVIQRVISNTEMAARFSVC
jgi:hypothetical protein